MDTVLRDDITFEIVTLLVFYCQTVMVLFRKENILRCGALSPQLKQTLDHVTLLGESRRRLPNFHVEANPSTGRPSFPQTTSTTFIHVSGGYWDRKGNWAWALDFCQLCHSYAWRAWRLTSKTVGTKDVCERKMREE